MPLDRSSRRAGLLGLLGIVVLVQTATTRGQVQAADGHTVEGADVLLADSTHVIARTRTDGRGNYRLLHLPINRDAHQLLICAPGFAPFRDRHAASALISTSFTLNPLSESSKFWSPERQGWRLSVPPSCLG